MVARVRREPLVDAGVRMRSVVVQDEMDLSTTGHLAIHLVHEFQELLMAVAGLKGGEQGRRAVYRLRGFRTRGLWEKFSSTDPAPVV